MSYDFAIYLYRRDGSCWHASYDDFKKYLDVAIDYGWRPTLGNCKVGNADARELQKALIQALAALDTEKETSDGGAISPDSSWGQSQMERLRALIDFCELGFETTFDEFPTLATREEMLEHVRKLASEEIGLRFHSALGGTCSSLWRRVDEIGVALGSIDRYLGGNEVDRVFKEAEEAFAEEVGPVWWKAFKHDREVLKQLVVQATAEIGPSFWEQLMKYVRGERDEHAYEPALRWARNAKALIADNPELGLPKNKTQLLSAMTASFEASLRERDDSVSRSPEV